MKLLICTQIVDEKDPVLGFFVRWLEEFAKHCERVDVICLYASAHTLPTTVRVHPLRSRSTLGRAAELLKLSGTLEYDAVFVHMNPEYLVVVGWFWRLCGKRVALWYTHKSVDLKLRIATLFATLVLTASKESFRLKSAKVQVVGHGIDTEFFTPDPSVVRGDWYLSVGRLMKSKRHDLAIRQAQGEGKKLRIVGEGPERERLTALARELNASVQFLGSMRQQQLRDEYRHAECLIHTSETGSLDKVVLEALACGLPIRTRDPALKHLEHAGPEYVRAHHSLRALVPAILRTL